MKESTSDIVTEKASNRARMLINVSPKDTVVLPFRYANIKSTLRQDDSLIIILVNDKVVELRNFFKTPHKLLLNIESNTVIEELSFSDVGTVIAARIVPQSELKTLLTTESLVALSSQATDALLFDSFELSKGESIGHDNDVLLASLSTVSFVGIVFASSFRKDEVDQNNYKDSNTSTVVHPDGSKTIVTRFDTNDDSKIDKIISIITNTKGEKIAETIEVREEKQDEAVLITKSEDHDGDERPDIIVTTFINKEGDSVTHVSDGKGVDLETIKTSKNVNGIEYKSLQYDNGLTLTFIKDESNKYYEELYFGNEHNIAMKGVNVDLMTLIESVYLEENSFSDAYSSSSLSIDHLKYIHLSKSHQDTLTITPESISKISDGKVVIDGSSGDKIQFNYDTFGNFKQDTSDPNLLKPGYNLYIADVDKEHLSVYVSDVISIEFEQSIPLVS